MSGKCGTKKESWEKAGGKRRAIVGISVLFYAVMLFLALGARRLHEGSLAHVSVTTPTIKSFSEDDIFSVATTLPEELLRKGKLFVVERQVVNGEVRTIAREVTKLVLGRLSVDGYREIVDGVEILGEVIADGGDGLQDGDEVIVKGEWSGGK